jgi:hypothetical protein
MYLNNCNLLTLSGGLDGGGRLLRILLLNVVRKFALVLAVVMALYPCYRMQAQQLPSKYVPQLPTQNVQYDYRWELYGGAAYSHFIAGPDLPGTNLYGFDVEAARFLRSNWAITATGRGYYGSTSVEANSYGVTKPPVRTYLFMGGPEYRRAHNQHLSMTLHAYFGTGYGLFNSGVKNKSGGAVDPELVGMYKNQLSRGAGAFGGSLDFNVSERWAVRVAPEATLTDFRSSSGKGGLNAQYAATVGVVYRLKRGLRR